MSTPFALIGSSWDFARRQQVLPGVAAVLLFLPLLGINVLTRMLPVLGQSGLLVAALGLFLLSLVMLWGNASVLVVGKRLLSSNAGRTRTSSKAVRSQARGFVLPLLLTDVLRSGMTLLWALPVVLLVGAAMAAGATAGLNDAYKVLAVASVLLLPAVVYSLRTTFASVLVVAEGVSYRPALRASLSLSRGRVGKVALTLIGVSLTLFLPVQALAAAIAMATRGMDPSVAGAVTVAGDAAVSALQTVSLVLFTLSTILLYKELSVPPSDN